MSKLNTYSEELKEQISTLEEQILQTVMDKGVYIMTVGTRTVSGGSFC